MTDYISKHSGPTIDGAIDKVPVLEQEKVDITNGNATGLTLNGTTTATGNINCDETVTSFKATIDEATITAGYIEDGFITNTNLGDGTIEVNGDEGCAEIGHLKLTFDDGGYNSLFKPIDDSTVAFKEIDYIDCQDLNVRGNLNVYELVANKIRSTNGYLYVTDSDTVEAVEKDMLGSSVTFKEGNFRNGDYILTQFRDGNNWRSLKYVITSMTERVATLLPLQVLGENLDYTVEKDMYFVRIDSTEEARQTGILLSPYDSSYIDFYKGNGKGTGSSVTTSIGNLDHLNKEGASGFGLYSENAHLKGQFILSNGTTVEESLRSQGINLYHNGIVIDYVGGFAATGRFIGGFKCRTNAASGADHYIRLNNVLDSKTEYTVQFKIWASETTNIKCRTPRAISSATTQIGTTWKTVTATFIPEAYSDAEWNYVDIMMDTYKAGVAFEIKDIMVERNDRVSEYALSPMDSKLLVDFTKEEIEISLGNAGINIESGEVTLKGDKVNFTDSTGTKSHVSINPDTGTLVATNAHLTGEFILNNGKSVVEATEDAIKLSLEDSTGIDIETGQITLRGDKVRFTDSSGNNSLVGIDPSTGALVATEAVISGDITTNRMIATDNNNKMLSSVNLNGQGEYIQYRGDDDSKKLMEFNNGNITYYNADGSVKWVLGESGTIDSLVEYWEDVYWCKTDSMLTGISQYVNVKGGKYKEFKATIGSTNQQYIGLTVDDYNVQASDKPQDVPVSDYIPDGTYTFNGTAMMEISPDGNETRAYRRVVDFRDGKHGEARKVYYLSPFPEA